MLENLEDLFAENCLLPCLGDIEQKPVRKDLDTLLKELNAIENDIELIKEKQGYLTKLRSLHMGVIPN